VCYDGHEYIDADMQYYGDHEWHSTENENLETLSARFDGTGRSAAYDAVTLFADESESWPKIGWKDSARYMKATVIPFDTFSYIVHAVGATEERV
jgi:hypothetical protein